jgi:hypothetical protein
MKTDLEYAQETRAYTKEWIENRIKIAEQNKTKGITPKADDTELTEKLKEHYSYYEKIIADLKK